MFREQERQRKQQTYKGEYDSTIKLLENTSILVRNFHHHSPYRDLGDERFAENDRVLSWLMKWEVDAKDNPKEALCPTTIFDVKSMILGFKEVCRIVFEKYPGLTVSAKRFNTDVVENTFCQVRARNGQNDNPTLAMYGKNPNLSKMWAKLGCNMAFSSVIPDPITQNY